MISKSFHFKHEIYGTPFCSCPLMFILCFYGKQFRNRNTEESCKLEAPDKIKWYCLIWIIQELAVVDIFDIFFWQKAKTFTSYGFNLYLYLFRIYGSDRYEIICKFYMHTNAMIFTNWKSFQNTGNESFGYISKTIGYWQGNIGNIISCFNPTAGITAQKITSIGQLLPTVYMSKSKICEKRITDLVYSKTDILIDHINKRIYTISRDIL